MPVSVLGHEALITGIEITAQDVCVVFEGSGLKDHHQSDDAEEYRPGEGCYNQVEIILYDKKGNPILPNKEMLPYGFRAGSDCRGNSESSEYTFMRIIDHYGDLLNLDDIAVVKIAGQAFKID